MMWPPRCVQKMLDFPYAEPTEGTEVSGESLLPTHGWHQRGLG